jgi:hypothetical protein
MKTAPVTFVILVMFGSFVVILTAMVVVFRPDPQPARVRPEPVQRKPARPVVARADSGDPKAPIPDGREAQSPPAERVQAKPPTSSTARKPPRAVPMTGLSVSGRRLQKELQQEQREMALLKSEMKRRLARELAIRDQKLSQLADKCEQLETGEAAQVLLKLDDETVSEVLRRMETKASLKILVLLRDLGRDAAVPVP